MPLSHLVFWARFGSRWMGSDMLFRKSEKYTWLCLFSSILLSSILLASCAGFHAGSSSSATPTPATMSISAVHWCGKPQMVFRDEGASVDVTATSSPTTKVTPTSVATLTPAKSTPTSSTALAPANGTPTTITDWRQVKANLGFVVFLPRTLPAGSCLVSASGTLRDPILGSSFMIGYLLANHDALTLSEAPLRSQNITFQCSISTSTTASGGNTKTGTVTPSVTQVPVQLCTGARDTTNIVFSARGTTDSLRQFLSTLQSNLNWIPTA